MGPLVFWSDVLSLDDTVKRLLAVLSRQKPRESGTMCRPCILNEHIATSIHSHPWTNLMICTALIDRHAEWNNRVKPLPSI